MIALTLNTTSRLGSGHSPLGLRTSVGVKNSSEAPRTTTISERYIVVSKVRDLLLDGLLGDLAGLPLCWVLGSKGARVP
jgi:hypothetical protein